MTHPFCASVNEHIEIIGSRVLVCLDCIESEKLWEDFAPNLASPGNLVLHLAGNLSQYVLKGLGEQDFRRDRTSEFAAKPGTEKDALGRMLSETLDRCKNVIEGLGEDELRRTRSVQGFSLTGYGILIHVTEHLSHHAGQFTWFCKYVFGADIDFYRGRDLNVG